MSILWRQLSLCSLYDLYDGTKDDVLSTARCCRRGLLLCAREDGCWQVAVLLGEQAQRDGITLGVYSVDMLCSVSATLSGLKLLLAITLLCRGA